MYKHVLTFHHQLVLQEDLQQCKNKNKQDNKSLNENVLKT